MARGHSVSHKISRKLKPNRSSLLSRMGFLNKSRQSINSGVKREGARRSNKAVEIKSRSESARSEPFLVSRFWHGDRLPEPLDLHVQEGHSQAIKTDRSLGFVQRRFS